MIVPYFSRPPTQRLAEQVAAVKRHFPMRFGDGDPPDALDRLIADASARGVFAWADRSVAAAIEAGVLMHFYREREAKRIQSLFSASWLGLLTKWEMP